jgi:DNA-binding GntR family transcriptional regulator
VALPPPLTTSSVDKACQVIREAIHNGQYPGGFWIREIAVAQVAEVSRTSVRQALNVLAAEGYVELHPNRGAMVVDWTEENLLQVFDMRAMLESYGCELAARHRTAEELGELQREADRFSALVDHKGDHDSLGISESNNRFHRLISGAGRNARLASLLVAVVHVPMVKQTFAKYDRTALVRSAQQHHDLVAAIGARDPAWARATMAAHILAGKNIIFGSGEVPAQDAPVVAAALGRGRRAAN